MAVWLDILGALLLGSMLLLNVLRMNVGLSDHAVVKTFTYGTQSSATALAEIVEDDLRKAGLGVSGTAFLLADSTQIRFVADLNILMDMNGTIDTVYYHVGDPEEAVWAINPRYRFLHRDQSGQTAQIVGAGVTDFSFSYFGAAGDSLALPVSSGDLANIRQIRLDFRMESDAPQDVTYAQTSMQLRIFPKNL